MRPPDIEGRPPAGSRPKTSPTPASPYQTIPTGKDTAQLDLESYRAELATRARDTGIESAARADDEWCRRVSEFIYDLAPGETFTADTIRSRFSASNASGPVILSAARRRVIRHVGWTKSTAITRHGSDIKIWERT